MKTKLNKTQRARLAKEQAAARNRVKVAVSSGVRFEHFKSIADDSVIPDGEHVLAGYDMNPTRAKTS